MFRIFVTPSIAIGPLDFSSLHTHALALHLSIILKIYEGVSSLWSGGRHVILKLACVAIRTWLHATRRS